MWVVRHRTRADYPLPAGRTDGPCHPATRQTERWPGAPPRATGGSPPPQPDPRARTHQRRQTTEPRTTKQPQRTSLQQDQPGPATGTAPIARRLNPGPRGGAPEGKPAVEGYSCVCLLSTGFPGVPRLVRFHLPGVPENRLLPEAGACLGLAVRGAAYLSQACGRAT